MTDPRRASVKLLAFLTLALLAAALPQKRAAQSAPANAQSPNGKIVFQSTQGGDGYTNDIYVMDADGKRQTRLTDDPGDDTSAVWSPQGDKIAFLSDRRGSGREIYLMNADGSNPHPLRNTPVSPFSSFVWSPDGTRLAYDVNGNVYVITVDGDSDPVNVSAYKDPNTSLDSQPSWSPGAGSRLVVRNTTTPCDGCSDLYVVNASDGGNRVKLQTGPGFDESPRWSPTADVIAYEGDRGGRGLYVTAADGLSPEKLISGTLGSWGPAEWSHDGSRLAFLSALGSVYVVKSDGTDFVNVSEVPASSGNVFWSPDGSKVGYHNGNADGWVDILIVSADGSSRRAANYTKTRRADEYAHSWQKLPTQ